MRQININTKLVSRDEVFKLLAVAEATGFPVLLIGPPGTGKTNCVLDYMAGRLTNPELVMDKTFILETDEGTKSGEVKGKIDIKKLVMSNEYEKISPIVDAEAILINEIDKANAGLRNSLLGIMNEKFLFDGEKKVKCVWRIFASAVNEIPAEEKGSPFWDRFVLKTTLSRISKTNMLEYYKNTAKGAKSNKTITINIPDEKDLADVEIDPTKLEKFIQVCFDHLSDRTLSYVPRLVAAVHHVYGLSVNKALIKTCQLLLDMDKAKQLATYLEPKELTALRADIDLITNMQDAELIIQTVDKIRNSIKDLAKNPNINKADLREMLTDLENALQHNPIYQATEEADAQEASK